MTILVLPGGAEYVQCDQCGLIWFEFDAVLIAPDRYGGLRCPSEVLALRWANMWGRRLPKPLATNRSKR